MVLERVTGRNITFLKDELVKIEESLKVIFVLVN